MTDVEVLERDVPTRVRSRQPLVDPAFETATPRSYNFNAPLLGGQDIVALVLAFIMALGPLTMYAIGYGL